jgi:wobble nucleotide-excising tRNase
MLRKVLAIKNVGRFEDCRWRGGSQFESMVLIFAENARGKSTFSDILRSCQTNSPDTIIGRRRLGANGASEVELRTDASNLKFDGTTWSAPLPNLAIFDSTFIHQNVYAGDRIDHDHKKNLYHVIVGEQGVKLARKVERLDSQIRDATRELNAKRDVLSALLPHGTELKNFAALAADPDIVTKIAAKENEIKIAEAASRRAAEITAKGLLREIAVPGLPGHFEVLLLQKLPNLAEGAERKLRVHLSEHTTGGTENWIQQGLSYQKDEVCPMCGQSTGGLDLIQAYRAYFDKAYGELKQQLAVTQQIVGRTFGDKAALAIQATLGNNAALWEFWRQLGIGEAMNLADAHPLVDALSKVHDEASELLAQKIAAPLEAVALGNQFRQALADLARLSSVITEYNATLKALNAEVSAFKAKQTIGDVSKLKAELAGLRLVQIRHSADGLRALSNYIAAEQAKTQLEKEKIIAKNDLDNYAQAILATHEKRINELLQMFGANFRIDSTERSYVGGRPSSNYKLLINGVSVELGDEATPESVPSFRNTLSSGDRNTLALALFMSQLERDPNLKDKIVVFDDPFTSQDRSRRTATQALICNLGKTVAQIFVLSHDPHFLRALWDGYKGGGGNSCFQFMRMGNGTGIGDWDVVKETAGGYAKKHRVLWNYKYYPAICTTSPREVAQTIRPVLEEYLRLKLPHSFGDREWLGDFIAKIRNALDTDPLAAAKCIVDRLTMINEFSKRYHHNSNPNADAEILDEAELLSFVEQTLKLVGGF